MAKQMILVDPTQLMKRTNPVPDSLSDSVIGLDNEMKKSIRFD